MVTELYNLIPDVNLDWFPTLTPLLDANLSVLEILIVLLDMSVRIKDVLRNLTLVIPLPVVQELDVWQMEMAMPSAGIIIWLFLVALTKLFIYLLMINL